jgi:hypothetical protein
VAKHDYNPFTSIDRPIVVVASDDDFATDGERLQLWFDALPMPRQLVRQRCDNHFFRGHEPWLVETVFGFLDARWR